MGNCKSKGTNTPQTEELRPATSYQPLQTPAAVPSPSNVAPPTYRASSGTDTNPIRDQKSPNIPQPVIPSPTSFEQPMIPPPTDVARSANVAPPSEKKPSTTYPSGPVKINASKDNKKITIYTSIEDRKTKLRSRVQVVLTLTPAWCSTETKRIAWKVIDFVPNLDIQKKVGLPPGTSISTLSQGHDDVNIAHDFFPLTPNTCISLQTDDGNAFWEEDDSQVVDDNLFRVRNNPIPKKLALCVHDDDEDKSDPVVFLGESSDIKTGPPVMLEAYVVSHFKEGQIVELENRESIIMEDNRKGVAIDLNRKDEFVFHLYCEGGGRPVLRAKNL